MDLVQPDELELDQAEVALAGCRRSLTLVNDHLLTHEEIMVVRTE